MNRYLVLVMCVMLSGVVRGSDAERLQQIQQSLQGMHTSLTTTHAQLASMYQSVSTTNAALGALTQQQVAFEVAINNIIQRIPPQLPPLPTTRLGRLRLHTTNFLGIVVQYWPLFASAAYGLSKWIPQQFPGAKARQALMQARAYQAYAAEKVDSTMKELRNLMAHKNACQKGVDAVADQHTKTLFQNQVASLTRNIEEQEKLAKEWQDKHLAATARLNALQRPTAQQAPINKPAVQQQNSVLAQACDSAQAPSDKQPSRLLGNTEATDAPQVL